MYFMRFYPRNQAVRDALAEVLWGAPERLKLALPDPDGWVETCLTLSGRQIEEKAEAVVGPGCRLQGALGSGLFQGRAGGKEGRLKVSILICTFNREALVEQAIQSALAQAEPKEIIVVDDGSTDRSWEKISSIPEIRAFRQSNTGKPGALNRALQEATGDAFLVLDDDDLLFSGAISLLREQLEARLELGVVWGDTIRFTPEKRRYLSSSRLPAELAFLNALHSVSAWPGAMLVRREAQEKAGIYDARLIRGQDIDMLQRLSRVARCEGIPIPVFWNRLHPGLRGSASQQWEAAEHGRHFSRITQPVFLERYRAASPGRKEGHHWALGLLLRGLKEEACKELARWEGPWEEQECWIRSQVGLGSEKKRLKEDLVVVDNGLVGARERILAEEGAGKNIWVSIEGGLDGVGSCQLHWPGSYVQHGRLRQWVKPEGKVHLRLSSLPSWKPPPLNDLSALPDLPPVETMLWFKDRGVKA
jgi:glycosyltransferase involved in cell wall biosynthesis